jgi:hypothetical protein
MKSKKIVLKFELFYFNQIVSNRWLYTISTTLNRIPYVGTWEGRYIKGYPTFNETRFLSDQV